MVLQRTGRLIGLWRLALLVCEDSFGESWPLTGGRRRPRCQHDCECMEGDSEDTYHHAHDSGSARCRRGDDADEDEDGVEDEECCVHHTYWADGSLAGTTCPQCCSPFDASTMSNMGNAGCTGYSDAGEVAPPFLDCRQEAIDAGSCGTGHICATCADYGVPTGQYWSFVGYASCPDWVVDALYEDAEDGGCASHIWTRMATRAIGPTASWLLRWRPRVRAGRDGLARGLHRRLRPVGILKTMAWDTIGGECYCFIEEWCDCVESTPWTTSTAGAARPSDGFDPEGMSEAKGAAADVSTILFMGGLVRM